MENNFKHTPGPWNLETNSNHFPFIMGDDNNVIATLFDWRDSSLFYGRTHEETTKNAKLIAAAPDLLEATTFSNRFPITSEKEEKEAQVHAETLGWKWDMPLENFAIQVRNEAIKKATE